jgi:hypothetical protein
MALPLAGFFFDPESQCGDGAYSSPLVVVDTVGSFPVVLLFFFFWDLLLVPGHFLVRFSLDDFRVCWCYCLLNEMHGYLSKKVGFILVVWICWPILPESFCSLKAVSQKLQFGLQPSVKTPAISLFIFS